MSSCKGCNSTVKDGFILGCPNCGATYCTDCANQSKRICPKCYHSLEYIG